MRLDKTILITVGLTLGLLSFVAGTAQTAGTAPAEGFPSTSVEQFPGAVSGSSVPTLHVTTREIVVDVMVTDGSGNPVHGLTQSDFSMEENGKPQSIRSFREFGTEIQAAEPAPKAAAGGVYQQPIDTGQRPGEYPAAGRDT